MICTSRTRVRTWVALALLALAGCGGGGDSSIGTKSIEPIPALSQAPAPEPCLSPVTADCVVEAPFSTYSLQMVGGRQSDYALSVRKGELHLVPSNSSGDFRFSGGTTVEGGTMLRVHSGSHLHSDVVVQLGGWLALVGGMTGDATNHGTMELWSTLVGNVVNDGALTPGSSVYDDVSTSLARIEGAFHQSSASTLDAVIGATSGGFVSVAGRADIDGTLRLVPYTDGWGDYSLPMAPVSIHVLHADGGISGRFATWSSPGLVITGNLRYADKDIFFDVTSISAAK